MRSGTVHGIVLHTRDYREADSIVSVYTESRGMLSGIAFGAKRSRLRFANCLDLFCKSRFRFVAPPNRTLVRWEECELVDAYSNLRKREEGMGYAAYFVDLVRQLTAEGDPNPALFRLLDAALSWLNVGRSGEEAARIFEIRLCTLLGYRLRIERCTRCGASPAKGETWAFYPGKGGILCPKCAGATLRTLSPGTLRVLQFVQRSPLSSLARLKLTPRNVQEAKGVSQRFLQHLLHKRTHTMNYIDRMEKVRNP